MEGEIYPFASYLSLPPLAGGQTDPWRQESVTYFNDPQISHSIISEKAYPTAFNSPSWSTSPHGIDEGGGTTYPESLPSLSPTIVGHNSEGVLPISVEHVKLADVDKTYNPCKDVTGTSTLTTTETSRHSCDTCGKQFSQSQGVFRHRRAAHKSPHLCFHLRCNFKWTRPCEYRAHLEKQHPNVNRDKILGKPAGSRCRSKIIGRDVPQHFLPPDVTPSRQSQAAEPRQCPMTPPLLPGAKVTPVSPPGMLSYDQPEHVESEIMSHQREDACVLELSDATDAPSASPSSEERVQSSVDGQFWLPPAFPGGSTAANRPSSPVTALIPTITPPVEGPFRTAQCATHGLFIHTTALGVRHHQLIMSSLLFCFRLFHVPQANWGFGLFDLYTSLE